MASGGPQNRIFVHPGGSATMRVSTDNNELNEGEHSSPDTEFEVTDEDSSEAEEPDATSESIPELISEPRPGLLWLASPTHLPSPPSRPSKRVVADYYQTEAIKSQERDIVALLRKKVTI
jgi:hypothetical protein